MPGIARAEAQGLLGDRGAMGGDHNHESLAATATTAPRGTFELQVADECEIEIGHAAEVLRNLRGRAGDVLFAYPYGSTSEFLTEEWLPANGERHGIAAAFGAADGMPVSSATSRWKIPRYVFGAHWKSTGELAAILRDAGIHGATRGPAPARGGGARTGQPVNDWRSRLRTWEVNDARVVAGELFRRSFGHEVPDYPRHFVLVYSPGRARMSRRRSWRTSTRAPGRATTSAAACASTSAPTAASRRRCSKRCASRAGSRRS
jgi:hypothetical protein